MKNTSVMPSATFDQMPSPSHRAKIGASTTRGSALIIFTYGSNTAARNGLRANQNPISAPATDPSTNASTDSRSVTQRWRQMVPSTNHLTMRENTSTGVEKKKTGSRSVTVSTCHKPIATIATRTWRARSCGRKRAKSPSTRLGIALEHFRFEHLPYFAMQVVERGLELHLGNVAGSRKRDAPFAQDAGGRAGRHDDD